MTRAPLLLLLLSAVALADDPPCTPTPNTATVEVNFKKGTSKLKDVATWYRKITCRDIEAPLTAADVPLSLTLEGRVSATRVAEVVRAAAASAGYDVDGLRSLKLQRSVEPCDSVKARAVLEKLAAPGCALDLDVFGKGECLDLRVALTPAKDSTALEVSQLKAGSLLHALGLREGDVLAEDRTALLSRAAGPHFELQLTRGTTKKTLRCEISGETARLHPLRLLKEALTPSGALVSSEQCAIDPALFTTKGDTVEVAIARAPEFDAACLMRASRIVPAYKDGKAQGFKLYAIRANTLLSLLGLQNGDTVKSINGRELDTPDKALEVYASLRDERKFTVQLERRGEPKTLVIVLK